MHDGTVCGRPLHANGYCALHLSRFRNGKPAMDAPFARWTKPTTGPCSHPGCEVQAYARGYCNAHYQRLLDGISLDHPIKRQASLPERVEQWLREAIPQGDCLICRNISAATGYATIVKDENSGSISRHRAVYKVKNGPIPKWAQVHHACSNRACINPEHLVLASQRENMAEMHGRNEYERRIAHLEALLADHHCAGCCCPR